jgi:hypothetical protein
MAYRDEVLTDTPYAFYEMQETSGTQCTDASGNARHGTYTGTPTLNQASLIPKEGSLKSVLFNGSSQYVSLPFNFADKTAACFEYWMLSKQRKNSTGVTESMLSLKHRLVSLFSDSGAMWNWALNETDGPNASVTNQSPYIPLYVATHIFFRWVTNYAGYLYINGVMRAVSRMPLGWITTGTGNSNIAADYSNTNFFGGQLSHVAIYDHDVSEARIQAHYDAGVYKITGSLTESLPQTDWIARAFDYDGSLKGERAFSGSNYSVPTHNYNGRAIVTIAAAEGVWWTATTDKFVGDYLYPTDAATTPYLYKMVDVAGDPQWDQVVALLHFNGSNGSTTITDQKSHTFTCTGNAAISTAQSKFGGASAAFDGTGDYISAPTSADWEMGAGNFTIETWFRTSDNTANQTIVGSLDLQGSDYKGWVLRYDPTQSPAGLRFVIFVGTSTNGDVFQYAWTPSNNTWYHIAVVRQGTTLTIYVDGTSIGSGTITTATTVASSGRALMIGAQDTAGAPDKFLNGYLDDLRITKGVRQVANFTAPTVAHPDKAAGDEFWNRTVLLLKCDGTQGSTTFTDSSSLARTMTANGNAIISTAKARFGTASGYFDGSGDYVTTPTATNLDIGYNGFTVEAWIYPTALTGTHVIVGRQEAGSAMVFQFRVTSTGALQMVLRSPSGSDLVTVVSSNGAVTTNAWQHVAAVRLGKTVTLYVNGTSVGSSSSCSQNLTPGGGRPLTVGALDDTTLTNYFAGYIDDVRLTRYRARYTANFTPTEACPSAYQRTHSSEPTWPTNVGDRVQDNTVTWECVGRLVQPRVQYPLIPS